MPAVSAGLRALPRRNCDDAGRFDLQNPPEEIPCLVAKVEEGFDVVGTVRVDRRDNVFRKLSSAIVNCVVQKSTGVLMHDYGCMLRAYRRNIVQAMLQCRERSTFIPILANSFARKTTEIDVPHAERTVGDSKYNLWKLINLQFDLLDRHDARSPCGC